MDTIPDSFLFSPVIDAPLYTSFAVPSTKLTPIPGTILLTCQDSTLKDDGPNNVQITGVGTPLIESVGPFGMAQSVRFDGASYLSAPASVDYALGTGDFSVELWIYQTSISSVLLVTNRTLLDSAGTLGLGVSPTGIYFSANISGNYNFLPNTWYHLAAVRAYGHVVLYINGRQIASGPFPDDLNNSQHSLIIGSSPEESFFTGLIHGVRIVKGSAIYSPNLVSAGEFESNTVTISGLSAPALVSASAGTLIINGLPSGPGFINNDDTLAIKLTSSTSYATCVSSVVTVGDYSAAFVIRTAPISRKYKTVYAQTALDYEFVPDSTGNKLTFIDIVSGQIAEIQAIDGSDDSALDPRDYVYVANLYQDSVYKVNPQTKKIVQTISGFNKPFSVSATYEESYGSPSGYYDPYVVVSDTGSKSLILLGASGQIQSSLLLPDVPAEVTSASNFYYVTLPYVDKVVSVRRTAYTLSIVSVLDLPAGSKPFSIKTDGSFLWITLSGTDEVAKVKIDLSGYTLIKVQDSPYGISIDSSYVWTSNSFSNSYSRIDRSTGLVTTVPCGEYPSFITENEGSVFVVGFEAGFIEQISKTTGQRTNVYTTNSYCYGLITDSDGNLWLSSYYQNTPSILADANLDPAGFTTSDLGPNPVNSKVYSLGDGTITGLDEGRSVGFFLPEMYQSVGYVNGVLVGSQGFVKNNDRLKIEIQLPSVYNLPIAVPLVISSHMEYIKAQTEPNLVPDPMTFTGVYDQRVRTWLTSNTQTVSGLTDGFVADLTFDPASSSAIILNGVEQTAKTVDIVNGDTISLKYKTRGPYTKIFVLQVTNSRGFEALWEVGNFALSDPPQTFAYFRYAGRYPDPVLGSPHKQSQATLLIAPSVSALKRGSLSSGPSARFIKSNPILSLPFAKKQKSSTISLSPFAYLNKCGSLSVASVSKKNAVGSVSTEAQAQKVFSASAYKYSTLLEPDLHVRMSLSADPSEADVHQYYYVDGVRYYYVPQYKFGSTSVKASTNAVIKSSIIFELPHPQSLLGSRLCSKTSQITPVAGFERKQRAQLPISEYQKPWIFTSNTCRFDVHRFLSEAKSASSEIQKPFSVQMPSTHLYTNSLRVSGHVARQDSTTVLAPILVQATYRYDSNAPHIVNASWAYKKAKTELVSQVFTPSLYKSESCPVLASTPNFSYSTQAMLFVPDFVVDRRGLGIPAIPSPSVPYYSSSTKIAIITELWRGLKSASFADLGHLPVKNLYHPSIPYQIVGLTIFRSTFERALTIPDTGFKVFDTPHIMSHVTPDHKGYSKNSISYITPLQNSYVPFNASYTVPSHKRNLITTLSAYAGQAKSQLPSTNPTFFAYGEGWKNVQHPGFEILPRRIDLGHQDMYLSRVKGTYRQTWATTNRFADSYKQHILSSYSWEGGKGFERTTIVEFDRQPIHLLHQTTLAAAQEFGSYRVQPAAFDAEHTVYRQVGHWISPQYLPIRSSLFKFTEIEFPNWSLNPWYECHAICLDLGMFATEQEALDDGVAEGYSLDVLVAYKTPYGCWVWTTIDVPRGERFRFVGGYISGG